MHAVVSKSYMSNPVVMLDTAIRAPFGVTLIPALREEDELLLPALESVDLH